MKVVSALPRPALVSSALMAGVLLVAACSPATPSATTQPIGSPSVPASAGPSSATGEIDAETVTVGSALAQIRGHHQASLELYAAGDMDGSLTHASHPVAEIIESIRSDLDDAGAPTAELESALEAVITAAQGDSEEDLAAAIESATELVNQSEDAVAGDAATSSAYRGSVVSDLLATVADEYGEAITDGAITLLVEYQDAYAFAQDALDQYAAIADEVEATNAEEAAEIDEAFETLTTALPAVLPPATITSIEDVDAATALIAHELEEVVGALPISDVDPEAEQAAIEGLLDEIVEMVEADNRAQAAELAAEAYLEHYEVIEAAVIAAAPEVNTELEPLLGAELRRQINEGASLEEIQAMVAQAKELLSQAIESLEHH